MNKSAKPEKAVGKEAGRPVGKQTIKQTGKAAGGFTAEEKAAMKERARELKTEARADKDTAAGERELLAKIADMPEPERRLAMRVHKIVKSAAPELTPRTWYGMPAYARHGKIVCFFQSAAKFKTRYATLGFSDQANLDDGNFWPTAFALRELSATDEAMIATLVKKALR